MKQPKGKKRETFPLLAIITILSISIFLGAWFTSNQKTTDYRSRAANVPPSPLCHCTDPNSCYDDQCTRNSQKNPSICDGGSYSKKMGIEPGTRGLDFWCANPPPCCADIVRTGSAYACCWPERAFCWPAHCDQITKGDDGFCGRYYEFHEGMSNNPAGYGCMRGDSPDTLVNMQTGEPISRFRSLNPQPTTYKPPPTTYNPQPTTIPTPTLYIQPTDVVKTPTQPQTPTTPLIQPTQIVFIPPPTQIPETSIPTPTPKPILPIAETIKGVTEVTHRSTLAFLTFFGLQSATPSGNGQEKNSLTQDDQKLILAVEKKRQSIIDFFLTIAP